MQWLRDNASSIHSSLTSPDTQIALTSDRETPAAAAILIFPVDGVDGLGNTRIKVPEVLIQCIIRSDEHFQAMEIAQGLYKFVGRRWRFTLPAAQGLLTEYPALMAERIGMRYPQQVGENSAGLYIFTASLICKAEVT